MENNQQELIYKLSMFEQQMQQLQQQIQAVDKGIVEMSNLTLGLKEFNGAKEKDILAPLGRGIFAKAKLTSEEFLVDIGGKNFVKKSISETQEMIEKQVNKLEDVKKELNKNLENLNQELTNTFMEAQIQQDKDSK